MNARMDTIKRLAESDPYWRAYLDGMVDRHAIRRTEYTDDAWREYARLAQARLDRNADTTDYDAEWKRMPTSADHLREYENAVVERANELQAHFNATLSRAEVRDALQAPADR